MMEKAGASSTAIAPSVGVEGRLALAFQELITITVRLRAGRQNPTDLEAFRTQIRELLVQADAEARNSGYPAAFVKLAVYVTIAFLDEVVLNTRGPSRILGALLANLRAGRVVQGSFLARNVVR